MAQETVVGESGRGATTPSTWVRKPMATNALTGLETAGTTDTLARDQQTGLVFDWGSELPVEVPGGDVVFVKVLRRTDDGHALTPAGDVPVAVTSVYSPTDVRNALREAGYATEHIEIAMNNTLTGEAGRTAARIAESINHDHKAQLVTDGGRE